MPEDVISINELNSGKRIQFSLRDGKSILFVLDDPNLALSFSKMYGFEYLCDLQVMISDIERVLTCDPEKLGFECEQF